MSLEKQLKDLWTIEKKRFNHPAVLDPRFVDSLDGQDSAALDFSDRSIKISRGFVKDLSKYLQIDDLLKAVVRHEVGHWTYFPRELSDALYLQAYAQKHFKNKGPVIYMFYSDLANEGHLLHNNLAGNEILKMRETFAQIALQKKEKPSAMLNNLLRAMYSNTFKDLPGIKLDSAEEKIFEKLKDIPYINISLDEHHASLYRFGKAIEHLIPEAPSCMGHCRHGSIDGIPVKELDQALDGVLQKKGIRGFKVVKAFIREKRPDYKDPYDAGHGSRGAVIGAGKSEFKLNDDQIPLYKRWAAGNGVYIVKRPIEKDDTALFRSGKKEFEVGDSVSKTDVFGSRGLIGIPGVSKVHLEEEGTIPSTAWSVPHLNLGIDSSGSMAHPSNDRGAMQVLAAFVLGKNYHANGSHVGGWNFSEDIAFLPPSRDLDAFYSLMCGYWGGGTVLNVEKLKKFVEESRFGDSKILLSDEKDYHRLLDRMSDEEKKKVMDKSLQLDMSKVKAKYEKLDNILITDGCIGNIAEVLRHLQDLGKITRNFVFLTDAGQYDDWSKLKLPNTTVYKATTPEELRNVTLGRAKALVTEAKYNYRGKE